MLRITVEEGARLVTLRLEGRLTGPWLRELDACWQNCVGLQHARVRYVDLTGVTFIDSAGKACLAAMYRQGAEFIAADCMTKEIVAEIARSSLAEGSELAPTTKPQGVPS
jgi:ABC-type transporter Mla MlaB component